MADGKHKDSAAKYAEWMIPYKDLKLEKEIGRGAYGMVYLANYLGTEVAVKRISNFDDDDEVLLLTEYADDLVREVKVLREMRHPNIVQFMGVVSHQTGFYIITEYVPKGSLRQWLKDLRVEISWKIRVSMLRDVARAMAYLHSKNIIHRDLKSKNLLVDENVRVKVCDFGLAREYDPHRLMSMAGTDAWIAPEVILGMDYDHKCDVFSYGVVVCEVITRKKPDKTTLKRHLPDFHIDPKELRSLTPEDCPKALVKLAMDCIEVNQQRRPTFEMIVERLTTLETELDALAKQARHKRSGSAASNGRRSGGSRKASRHKSSRHAHKRSAGRRKEQADAMADSRFEVQVVTGKLSKKQPRILEVKPKDGVIRLVSREGELKKQFRVAAVKETSRSAKDPARLHFEFIKGVDETSLVVDFLSTAELTSMMEAFRMIKQQKI